MIRDRMRGSWRPGARENLARRVVPLACALAALLTAATMLSGASLSAQQSTAPQISAQELVRETIKNEVSDSSGQGIKHMFRSRKTTPKGSQTRIYVETTDSMAGLTIAENDKPLTPQEEQAEIGHLDWLAQNPDQLRKKHARENQDAQRSTNILKALPDAFFYQYAGTEPGTADTGKVGHQLIRLKFTPNPKFSPPSREEEVLEGMDGYLLIDANEHRLARIDGTLFRDVSFGWGVLGRLDQGGHFEVQQADVGDGSWELTKMDLHITGKILLIKSLSMIEDEVFYDFQRVPDNLSFARGVELLKDERDKLAHISARASSQMAMQP
ncbi:MAG TPA: hypothetical protein VMD76_10600 [Candidatus Sulfotelmatobacter sp.]|nr:hypothetical protein [Candidatus Sulfotelmatobacter sp.]